MGTRADSVFVKSLGKSIRGLQNRNDVETLRCWSVILLTERVSTRGCGQYPPSHGLSDLLRVV